MTSEYVSSYILKREAREAMHGNMMRVLYACIVPEIAAVALLAVIIAVVPGAFDSVRMVIKGSFENMQAQMTYTATLFDTLSNAVLAVSLLFEFMTIGKCFMLLKMYKGEKPPLKSLFMFLPNWLTATAFFVILNLVPYLLSMAVTYMPHDLQSGVNMVVLALTFVLDVKLLFVPYILAENGCTDLIGSIKASWKGVKMVTVANYIMVTLSFVGWIFLCVLTFGIGLFYVVPYIEMTMTSFYKRAYHAPIDEEDYKN